MTYRPLRDACDAYVKACEANDVAHMPPGEFGETFVARVRAASALAAIMNPLDRRHISPASARVIRDAINAAWEAGYEERVEDEGK